jgi:hypothetical protein
MSFLHISTKFESLILEKIIGKEKSKTLEQHQAAFGPRP